MDKDKISRSEADEKLTECIKGAVWGQIVGDALGVPAEFIRRDVFKNKPIDRMMYGGSHNMPKGTWSDDSSMLLCTLTSIAEKQNIDLDDIMQRFSRWIKEGYMTPHGKPFGVGRTTFKAITKFWHGDAAAKCGCSSEKDNGNGSLMRILPVILYNAFVNPELTISDKIQNINAVSSLTHSHGRSCIACGIYSFILEELLAEQSKSAIHKGLEKAKTYYKQNSEYSEFELLFSEKFESLVEDEIKSSGYVVHTLEAAVWCILNTSSYREAVLKAVNLGDDADTVAAVTGGLAGMLYGYSSIPPEWIDEIVLKDNIADMCGEFEKALKILCSRG